jgi:hypothetical protein
MSAIDSVMLPSDLGPTRNPFNYERIELIDRDVSTAWLTQDEVQNQLNLFGDDSQAAYLGPLELAVRMAIEDYLGASFVSEAYRVYYSLNSLYGNPLALDIPSTLNGTPTITKVAYYASGMPPTETVLDPSVYFYDLSGNRVVISSMPDEINTSVTNPIWVEYTIGANPMAAYPVIKQAGLLLLTHLYNNRSQTTSKAQVVIPWGIDMLLRPYKPLIL